MCCLRNHKVLLYFLYIWLARIGSINGCHARVGVPVACYERGHYVRYGGHDGSAQEAPAQINVSVPFGLCNEQLIHVRQRSIKVHQACNYAPAISQICRYSSSQPRGSLCLCAHSLCIINVPSHPQGIFLWIAIKSESSKHVWMTNVSKSSMCLPLNDNALLKSISIYMQVIITLSSKQNNGSEEYIASLLFCHFLVLLFDLIFLL